MNKLFNVIGGIGFISLLLGMAGMDSESVIIPIAMIMVGLALVSVYSKFYDEFYTEK